MSTTHAKSLCAVILLFITHLAYSQYQDTISSGRPGISIDPFTVGKKVLQLEQGVEFFDRFEDTANINTYTTDHIIRYGLSERFEISALFEYQSDLIRNKDKPFERQHGISNLHLGFRVSLCDEKKWRPAIIYQMRFILPHISETYGADYVGTEMVVSTRYSLPKDINLDMNAALIFDGNTPAPLGQYVVNLNFPIVGNLSGFVENYGEYQSRVFETRVDGGLAYIITPNLQLDFSGGYGRNQGITDYFVNTGLSWRVKFRDRTL